MTIAARYNGDKRCLLTHPTGHRLSTDVPQDLGGSAAAFSPTDLVASGLLTCILTTIALWAERHALDVTGMTGTVEKTAPVGARRIERLAVTVTIPAERVPEALRERLEQIAHRCPVHGSLHPEIDAPIAIHYSVSV